MCPTIHCGTRRYFLIPNGSRPIGNARPPPLESKNVSPPVFELTPALTTNGMFTYAMRGFLDATSDSPIDELTYKDYPLRNCSIQQFQYRQINSPVAQVTV